MIASPVMVKVYLKAFPSFAMNIYMTGVLCMLISVKGILVDGRRKKEMRTSGYGEKYLRYRDFKINEINKHLISY